MDHIKILKGVGISNMYISTEQLKIILEEAFAKGYDYGAKNEKESSHNATAVLDERNKIVATISNTISNEASRPIILTDNRASGPGFTFRKF